MNVCCLLLIVCGVFCSDILWSCLMWHNNNDERDPDGQMTIFGCKLHLKT